MNWDGKRSIAATLGSLGSGNVFADLGLARFQNR
jgi:hypothetical protein